MCRRLGAAGHDAAVAVRGERRVSSSAPPGDAERHRCRRRRGLVTASDVLSDGHPPEHVSSVMYPPIYRPDKLGRVKPGRFTRKNQVDLSARQEYDNQDARWGGGATNTHAYQYYQFQSNQFMRMV